MTMSSSTEHKSPNVQFILDTLAGSLMVLTADGNFLFEDGRFEPLKPGKWAMVSPIDSFCVWEEARCMSFQEHVKAGGCTVAQKADQTPKRHQRKVCRCGFNVNPGFPSAQLLAAMEQYVSSTLDDLGQECSLETCLHRIIFVGMTNELEATDKPHKNYDFQQSQEVRGYAARFPPGCWNFVGPGNEKTWKYDKWVGDPNGNWDRKASHSSNNTQRTWTPSPSRHHNFRAGALKQKSGKKAFTLTRTRRPSA